MLSKLKNILNQCLFKFRFKRRWRALNQQLGSPSSKEYEEYLKLQLLRSYGKAASSLQKRTVLFIDQLAELIDLKNLEVLCVGCRNTHELDYFEKKGVRRVTGIDLHSDDPRVLVRDMHDTKFADRQFDLVYSSHSLEHSLKPETAAREWARILQPRGIIAIETPIRFNPRGADLNDYGSAARLLDYFKEFAGEIILSTEQPAESELNPSKTEIAQVIFHTKE